MPLTWTDARAAPGLQQASEMADELRRRFVPDAIFVIAVPGNYESLTRISTLLEGRRPGVKAIAYVCENSACKVPANSAAELRTQLGAA